MADSSRAVLSTGCSSGIGRATALRLAKTGRPVYATARRVETLEDLVAAGCRALPLDVTDAASCEAAVAEVEREHGAVGALVNNAGYGGRALFEQFSEESIYAMYETNVFGLMRVSRAVLPIMRQQKGGTIIIKIPGLVWKNWMLQ